MNKRGSVLITLGLLLLAGALGLTLYNVWDANRAGEASEEVAQEIRALLSASSVQDGETGEGTGLEGLEDFTVPADETAPDETAEADETTDETEASDETDPTDETEPDEATEPEETVVVRDMPTVEINGYRYIGIIEVESMDISLPVMEEWDYDRLRVAPCRFAGNVYEDNLVICAHNYATHFAPLKYAPIGTQVKFTDAEGNEFYYEVISLDTIGPNDVEGMIYGDWDLTLFTCNTNGQTRCAIRCQRVA